MKKSLGLLTLLLLPTFLTAQSPQSATGGEARLWAGAELSDYNPDYGCLSNVVFNCSHQLLGPTAFFDFGFHNKWSAEGDARWLVWNSNQGQKESSYTIGPRYRVWQGDRFALHGKINFGGMWLQTLGFPQAGSLKGSYFVVAPGADIDYALSNHLLVRAEYDYELLPSFAGPPTVNSSGQLVQHNSGLTPNGFSFGVAWRVLGP